MEKSEIFRCLTGNELINVEKWGGFLAIAIYKHYGGSLEIGTKWSHIKKILKDGEPYSDSLILPNSEFNRFKEFINSIEIENETSDLERDA